MTGIPTHSAKKIFLKEIVVNFFQNNRCLPYHNYSKVVKSKELCDELASAYSFDPGILSVLQDAALLLVVWEGFGESETSQLLEKAGISGNRKKEILRLLEDQDEPCETPGGRILSDIKHIIYFAGDYSQNAKAQRHELLLHGVDMSDVEWQTKEWERISEVKLYTMLGQSGYSDQVASKAISIKNKLARLTKGKQASNENFATLEDGNPERAVQTYFRSNYRVHINLSAIADNKANIMISVNSILISVLISVLTYQTITDGNPMLLFPIVIFLVTGLTSLTFAILSARPKVTSINHSLPLSERKRNIIFFGNFVDLSLSEFEEAMDEMFRSSKLIYGNMTRDIYFLGKVLHKKYHYLKYSYSVFMLGFVATVLTFLLAFFT